MADPTAARWVHPSGPGFAVTASRRRHIRMVSARSAAVVARLGGAVEAVLAFLLFFGGATVAAGAGAAASPAAPSGARVGVVARAGTSTWSGAAAGMGGAGAARDSTKTNRSQAAGRPGFVFFSSPYPWTVRPAS